MIIIGDLMKTMLETMEILLEAMSQDILAGKIRYETYVKAENVKARYLKTDKGYLNISKHSDETKQKIRDSH
jgi:hypothetical protein